MDVIYTAVFCVNCVYYREKNMQCAKYAEKELNLVTGKYKELNHMACSQMRSDTGDCGKSGKLYKEK